MTDPHNDFEDYILPKPIINLIFIVGILIISSLAFLGIVYLITMVKM